MGSKMFLLQVLLLVLLVGLYDARGEVIKLNSSNPLVNLKSPGYPNYAPPNSSKSWYLTGSQILEITCTDISLPKRANCTEGHLTIEVDEGNATLCHEISSCKWLTKGNRMAVRFTTKNRGGRMNCDVQIESLDEYYYMKYPLTPSICACGLGKGGFQSVYSFMAYLSVRESKTCLWPFKTDRALCGGTILTERHVLTAAHCLDVREDSILSVVIVGDKGDQTLDIHKSYIHEGYSKETRTNDIALLLLSEKIYWKAAPVCLPKDIYPQKDGLDLIALSWGSLRRTKWNADNIQLKMLTNASVFQNTTKICTENKKFFTKGDDGGPLLIERLGYFIQVGLIAPREVNGTVVNPKVFSYFDWIQDKIDEYGGGIRTCERSILMDDVL